MSELLHLVVSPDELETIKRLRDGESVEVRKVKGEWPYWITRNCTGETRIENQRGDSVTGASFSHAAAEWNKGAM